MHKERLNTDCTDRCESTNSRSKYHEWAIYRASTASPIPDHSAFLTLLMQYPYLGSCCGDELRRIVQGKGTLMDKTVPRNVLLQFIEDIPEPVREYICHEIQIFLWTDRKYNELIGSDPREFVRKFLAPSSDTDKLRATIIVSAILDFVLSEQLLHSLEKVEDKAAETGSTGLLKVALAESIRQRQLRQTVENWFVLRQTHLSAKLLHQHQAGLITRSGEKRQ